MKGKKVAVLYGGRSSEREVSLRSGAAIHKALVAKGYDAELLDVDLDVAGKLRAMKAEVAFIGLHGRYGEDGCIQGLLESMGIPYTGSGVLASALGMDKVATKQVFKMRGIPTADYVAVRPDRMRELLIADLPFGLPCVVKPSSEGSSVGVHIVKTAEEFAAACEDAAKYKGDILIERYHRGREVQCAVLDDEALGVIEVKPAAEFYDYKAKYDSGGTTRYLYPAPLDEAMYRKVMDVTAEAHKALGCAGATRTDLILMDDGELIVLETNTLPGMTEASLLPKIAAGIGIDFPSLCERILQGASLKA
ncbi:D-alanine--D-alanine ligase [Vulgatibacter sp.]|uniref:D-alanine--D-alanine ligase n=1 Tax=Vulgatibacter sp. TaxID=1971226 RepID=UPI003562AAC2